MTYIVQKFGGSSVATSERLHHVAEIVQRTRATGAGVVAVVSAMGNTTDELIALAHEVNADPPSREMDMLLSTGETVTAPLLAMALSSIGVEAISLTGAQAGIRTSASHRSARIRQVVPERILDALQRGVVPVVAGFQGMTDELDVTTLGRGGSDTSAVALAVAVGADRCEIYTDVAGVYTADPRVVPEARLLPEINYEEMLEFAAVGARVMHLRAVEIGEAYDMPIWVRSSFTDEPGTVIHRNPVSHMEDRKHVRGIASESNVAKVTVLGVPDRPGIAAALFTPLGANQINVDIIVQNVSHDGLSDVSFTIAQSDLPAAQKVLSDVTLAIGARGVDARADIAKVSVVGTGVRHTPGVFATAFRALADAKINIEMISSSEIALTCIVDARQMDEAAAALHRAFELDKL